MARNPAGKWHRARYGVILCIALLLVGGLEYLGFLRGVDQHFYDLALRMRGARDVSQEILVVAIDERSLERLGRWPIARHHYARLLEILNQAGAVGMDIAFSEPTDDDPAMGKAIEAHGRVVLPAYIDQRLQTSRPLSLFASSKAGHVHLEQDVDGVVRSVFHRLESNGTVLPSFSISLYVIGGRTPADVREERPAARPGPGKQTIYQSIPTLINYYGPQGSFPRISLVDALEEKWPRSFFRDKIVLVGVTAPGIEERVLTPFSQNRDRMPGVEVHAHILNNLVDGSAIRMLDPRVRWLLVPVFFLGTFALFVYAGALRSLLLGLLLLFGSVGIIFALVASFNLWVPPAAFLTTLALSYLLAYVFNLEKMGSLLLKAKEDWEESFNTIHDAIVVHDRDGRVVKANLAARETYGRPLLDLLTRRCLDLSSRPPVPSEPDPSGRGGPSGTPEFVDTIFAPEMERHFEIKSVSRLDDSFRFSGMVQTARDITFRIETEKEQRRLESQLIQAQKMEAIGTLAGGIAHDFNNMLAAMLGYTQLALMALPVGSDADRSLGQVLKAGDRAKKLVQRILTFSRRSEQEIGPVPVASITKEALKLLRATLPSDIEIKTDIRSDGKIMGDPTQIHQILMNLCTNSYHAMLEGGGTLRVALFDTCEESGSGTRPYVRLIVSDTGQGMTPEVLERVFDPYFTTKEKGVGTGLGMSVVHGIIQAHGGRIQVQSEPGKGTTIDILFPRIEDEAPLLKQESGPLPRGRERILLVDDEKPLLEMGKKILGELGYRVDTVESSVKALRRFKEDPSQYDLIITDMTMPRMTGEKLAGEMMCVREDIPVILCTGFSERMSAKKAAAMGIRAYLLKPVEPTDLARTIRMVLDGG